MRLVADEGVERQVVEALRQNGWEVLYVAELDPGIADETVLARAAARGVLLLTADKDFGELVFRQRRIAAGVVLIRLAGLGNLAKARLVADALARYGSQMEDHFTVIAPGLVRIRPRGPVEPDS